MAYVSYNNIVAQISNGSGTTETNPNAFGGVRFDGTTGQRITSTLSNSAEGDIGTQNFSIIVEFKTSLLNPSAGDAYGIWFIGSSQTDTAVERGIGAWINSDGSLQIFFRNASDGSTGANASYSGFMANFAGKIVNLVFARKSSGNPCIYINGQDYSSYFSFSQTSWTWQGSLSSKYFTVGTRGNGNEFIGDIYHASIYNIPLSLSEVLEIYLKSNRPPIRYGYGNFTGSITGVSSDFSSALTNWNLGFPAQATISGGTLNINTVNGEPSIFVFDSSRPDRLAILTLTIVAADPAGLVVQGASTVFAVYTDTGTKTITISSPYPSSTNSSYNSYLTLRSPSGTAVIDDVKLFFLGCVVHYDFANSYSATSNIGNAFSTAAFENPKLLNLTTDYFFATNFSAQNSTNLQRIKRIGQGMDYYNQTGPKNSTISTTVVPVSGFLGNQINNFLSYTGNSISGSLIEVPDYKFDKCFLKSLSINFEPWRICQASLQFDCYGLMTGSGIISQFPNEVRHNLISPLRGTAISIYNFGPISGKITEYENISFEVSVDRAANYEIGSEYPATVNVARITKTMQINGISDVDWISDYQANQEIEVAIGMSDGSSITIDGFLTNQSFSVDANGVAKTNLTIVEEVV